LGCQSVRKSINRTKKSNTQGIGELRGKKRRKRGGRGKACIRGLEIVVASVRHFEWEEQTRNSTTKQSEG